MSMNYVKEIKIESVEQLFKGFTLHGEYAIAIKNCIFRGESCKEYKLLPSALRDDKIEKLLRRNGIEHCMEKDLIKAEYQILSDFYRISNRNGLYVPLNCRFNEFLTHTIDVGNFTRGFSSEKWLPADLYEIAGLAQHYGLPTRLLDWSSSWKVALYFASVNSRKKPCDYSTHFVLWALDINVVNAHLFTNEEFPLKIIRPVYNNNDNLKAQKGLFTLWEINKPFLNNNCKTSDESTKAISEYMRPISKEPLDILLNERINYEFEKYKLDWPYKPILYKFLVPKELDNQVLTQLYYEDINGAALFPGYKGVQIAVEEMELIDNDNRYRV